jgi:hypothetical protein
MFVKICLNLEGMRAVSGDKALGYIGNGVLDRQWASKRKYELSLSV